MEATGRGKAPEMSADREIELLTRRVAANNKYARSQWMTPVERILGYKADVAVVEIPDLRQASQDSMREFDKTYLGSLPVIQKFLTDPSEFYIFDTGTRVVRNTQHGNMGMIGLPVLIIGHIPTLMQYGLDEDDFKDHVDAVLHAQRIKNAHDRYNKLHKNAIKRQTAEQASAAIQAQQASQGSSTTQAPPPPPTPTLTLAKSVGVPNPYFTGIPQTRYNGSLAGCTFINDSTRTMVNVVALALQQLGDPIVNVQYSNDGKLDLLYATTASGNVKIYIGGKYTEDKVVAVRSGRDGVERLWRLLAVYGNGSLEVTKNELSLRLNYGLREPPISIRR